MGAGLLDLIRFDYWGINHVIREVGIFRPSQTPPPRKREGLEVENNHQWPMI